MIPRTAIRSLAQTIFLGPATTTTATATAGRNRNAPRALQKVLCVPTYPSGKLWITERWYVRDCSLYERESIEFLEELAVERVGRFQVQFILRVESRARNVVHARPKRLRSVSVLELREEFTSKTIKLA